MNYGHRRLSEINRICDEFDSAWLGEKRPDLNRFLTPPLSESDQELAEALIRVDIEYRIQLGETPTSQDYKPYGPRAERMASEIISIPSQPKTDTALLVKTDFEDSTRGRYQLIKEFGQGGMGTVWIATQMEPVKRRVAVKILRSDVDSNDASLRFENERQTLAVMNHPNIAPIFDGGRTEEGRLYFVMEWVEGAPIDVYCDQNKLGLRERLLLIIDVCKALQHAHDHGVVHRDIKPDNVLVTKINDQPHPKVIDFGLAKVIRKGSFDSNSLRTEHGKLIGTVNYMSPEQASLKQLAIDERSDIYSLGALVYRLIAGSTPLEERTLNSLSIIQILEQIQNRDPERPSERASQQPDHASPKQGRFAKELDWLVMKAIEKNPDERYQTAKEFADDVRLWLAEGTVHARAQTPWVRLKKTIARKPVQIVGALVTTAAILVSTFLVQRYYRHAQSNEQIAKSLAISAFKDRLEKLEQVKQANHYDFKSKLGDYAVKLELVKAQCEMGQFNKAQSILDGLPEEFKGWESEFLSRLVGGSVNPKHAHQTSQPELADRDLCPPDASCQTECGNLVITGFPDGRVRVVNKENGSLVDQHEFDGTAITSVALDVHSTMVFATTRGGSVAQFDIGGSEVYPIAQFRSPDAISVSHDNSRIFVAEGTQIHVIHRQSGTLLLEMPETESPIVALKFQSDRSLVAKMKNQKTAQWALLP